VEKKKVLDHARTQTLTLQSSSYYTDHAIWAPTIEIVGKLMEVNKLCKLPETYIAGI
jgi:hypothetical protein